MGSRLLLDEMLSNTIASELRARGHDVQALVEDPGLTGLPDEEVLAAAISDGRALVTVNIKDFVPLDNAYRALGRAHLGLMLVPTTTFPQNRSFVGAIVGAIDTLLRQGTLLAGTIIFLQR